MDAHEIRSIAADGVQDYLTMPLAVELLREIAAQLAELNTNLKHFTSEVVSHGCIDVNVHHA